jgi:hypothetical protein
MNFEESLRYELATITGLEDKVYPLNASEGVEPPFVVYVSSEGEEIQTLDGYTGLTEITTEIHVVAASYDELKRFERAVIDKMQTFFGRIIGIDGVYVKSFSYTEPTETHENETGYERAVFDTRVRI